MLVFFFHRQFERERKAGTRLEIRTVFFMSVGWTVDDFDSVWVIYANAMPSFFNSHQLVLIIGGFKM